MAKIIIFGDIDVAPLRISVDGSKVITVSGKWPRYIYVSAGRHNIRATTETKFESSTLGGTWFANAYNTCIGGEIDLDDDEVLLIQTKMGIKSKIFNKVVKVSEAGEFVDMENLYAYGERAPGERNKWVVFFLCLFLGFLGVHRFYEKKYITGVLFLLTLGFCGLGVLYDLFNIFNR